MRKIKAVIFAIGLISLMASCQWQNKETLLSPFAKCDSLGTVSFAADIKPIMDNHCNSPSCHAPGGTAPGDFTAYPEIKQKVDNGTMVHRVLKVQDMPPAGPLSYLELSKLNCWISSGAPNN